MNRQSV
ncbi:EmrB/QacA family drug resistance transporter, partial [Pseudomonas amygdali pv. eriobotryae]